MEKGNYKGTLKTQAIVFWRPQAIRRLLVYRI